MFQKYIILRDYLHSQLRLEKHYSFYKIFALNAAKLLVPLALITAFVLAITCMAFGFAVVGTLFAIIFASICYGMPVQRVWANELILTIGIPMVIINGFSAFVRLILYNKLHNPVGDLYSIFTTVLLCIIGTLIIMTANSGNFGDEVTNPNTTDFEEHRTGTAPLQ